MADVVIGAKITADSSDAKNSVRSFKAELRQAQAEVVALAEKFGATSKEAALAAQKAAELQDAIGDAKSLVDAFNPDTKFRAFGASINTVVGGITALQGALGLVGVESQDVQKALLKVQSALALSQGISQLQEGVQTFKNLGVVIQQTTLFQKANAAATGLASAAMRAFGVTVNTTSTSFQVLKVAIAATGIGLLVIGLSAAADALGLFSSKTEDAAEAQEKLKGAIEGANAALDTETTFLNNQEKLDLARARNKGASEKQIFDIEQGYRRDRFRAVQRAYEELKGVDEKAAAEKLALLKQINVEGQVAQLDFETAERKRQQEAARKAAAEAEAARKKAEEEARRNKINPKKFAIDGIVKVEKTEAQLQIEQELDARLKAANETDRINRFLVDSDKMATEQRNANAVARVAAEQLEYENKVTLANATVNILNTVSNLVGQSTAAGKVFAIAAATIDTYVAATAVLRNTARTPAGGIPGFAIAQMASVIIAGIATVKKIISVKVPGGAGGGVAPSISQAAPLQATRPQNATTQLDQQSLNAIGSATTRAFVLESDVSNNQERIKRLNRAARL